MNRKPRKSGNAVADASSQGVRGVMLQNESIMEDRRRKEKNVVIDDGHGTSYDRDPVAASEEVPTDPVILENVEAPVDMEVVECEENTASVSKIIDIEVAQEETFDAEITGDRFLTCQY